LLELHGLFEYFWADRTIILPVIGFSINSCLFFWRLYECRYRMTWSLLPSSIDLPFEVLWLRFCLLWRRARHRFCYDCCCDGLLRSIGRCCRYYAIFGLIFKHWVELARQVVSNASQHHAGAVLSYVCFTLWWVFSFLLWREVLRSV
jgi:hypothetical protein